MKKYSHLFFYSIIVLLSIACLSLFPNIHLLIRLTVYIVLIVPLFALFNNNNNKIIKNNENQIKILKNEVNKFNFELEASSGKVSSVSAQIALTLDENKGFTDLLFERTKKMNELNSNVNETMQNIISDIKSVIELMNDSRHTCIDLEQISSASNDVIKKSLSEILEIVTTINEIQSSTTNMTEYVDKLSNTSKEISGILEVVSNISTQTNLLALNASIESARAGESGKGFAVVAEEIRHLSIDTVKAVDTIASLVKTIESEVAAVSNVTLENSERVKNGVSVSQNIGQSLEKINASFGDVLGLINKINELSENEVNLTSNVETKIQTIENITHLSDQSVENVYDSVQKQKLGMEELSQMGSKLNDASNGLIELIKNTDAQEIKIDNAELDQKISEHFAIIKSEILSNSKIFSMDKTVHFEILKDFITIHDLVEAAWTNDSKGRFICSIPEAGIANARAREWFNKSIQGNEYVSKVYISAITKTPCITLSLPIKSSDGSIIGVIGIDLKLHTL